MRRLLLRGESIPMQSKFTQKNQSVDKVLKIIEYMSEMRMPMKLQDISKGIGFPPSTILRLLTSLIDMGYVYQDVETLKYSLTLKFCRIGDSVKSSLNVSEIVHPYLLNISNQSGETTYFAIEQDMTLVYLDAIAGFNTQNSKLQRIGKVAPLHATGIGKLLLLNYDDNKLKKMVNTIGLSKYTEHTISSYEALKRELEKIQMQGYAIDNEECEEGVRCISMPIRDYTGNIFGGISISGSVDRIVPERFEELLGILGTVSRDISEKLGYVQAEG